MYGCLRNGRTEERGQAISSNGRVRRVSKACPRTDAKKLEAARICGGGGGGGVASISSCNPEGQRDIVATAVADAAAAPAASMAHKAAEVAWPDMAAARLHNKDPYPFADILCRHCRAATRRCSATVCARAEG